MVPDERVLDLGCGQGVLAPYVLRARARYVGVDTSRALLRLARRRHGAPATFLHGDARALTETTRLEPGTFDAVVILFSLQDIDPLEAVLHSAADMLRPYGRLVFLIAHPAFRVPRQSGWGWDGARKLTYRRVDSYLSRMAIPLLPSRAGGAAMTSYHRPLSDYLNSLAIAGLNLDRVLEVTPGEIEAKSKEIPLYLAVRASKPGTR